MAGGGHGRCDVREAYHDDGAGRLSGRISPEDDEAGVGRIFKLYFQYL